MENLDEDCFIEEVELIEFSWPDWRHMAVLPHRNIRATLAQSNAGTGCQGEVPWSNWANT